MVDDRSYERWQRRVRVAQGQEPADTVLTGGQVLNVFTQQLVSADVAICDERIAGVGSYSEARERVDATGTIIAPSFIDAHMHIESTMLWVTEFARAVVPHGTGAVIADPHEIANVAGLRGVDEMRHAAQGVPLSIHWTAPSCVPASPLESPGSTFTVDDITQMLTWPECAGLGEMMNFPAVLNGEREVYDKLHAARDVPRDGHGPSLRGPAVQAYRGAGPGSDHETTEADEGRDKLAAGMMLMLRQGSTCLTCCRSSTTRRGGAAASPRMTATPTISFTTDTSTTSCAPSLPRAWIRSGRSRWQRGTLLNTGGSGTSGRSHRDTTQTSWCWTAT